MREIRILNIEEVKDIIRDALCIKDVIIEPVVEEVCKGFGTNEYYEREFTGFKIIETKPVYVIKEQIGKLTSDKINNKLETL